MKAGSARRCAPRTSTARRSPSTGSWDSEEEARAIGEEIEELQRAGENLNEVAILVRASFQMREFEDRFVTLGLPYRVIGGPRFYERAEIRDALAYLRVDQLAGRRSRLRAHRQCAEARARRRHRADAARPCPQAPHSAVRGGARRGRNRRVEAEGARARCATSSLHFDRWRAQREVTSHTELAEIVLDESGYTEMWQKDRSADAAGRLDNLKELVRSMEEFENLQGFLEHISLVMDRDGGADGRSGVADDAAFGQGARIRQRVPARLGGRPVSEPAHARRTGPRRPRGRAAPRPCRADPRAPPRQTLFRHQPPHPRHVVDDDPVALPRRTAVGQCRDHGIQGRLRLGRQRRLRPVALRQCGILRLQLHDAGLAARAGQPQPRPGRPQRTGARRLRGKPVAVSQSHGEASPAASRATSAARW